MCIIFQVGHINVNTSHMQTLYKTFFITGAFPIKVEHLFVAKSGVLDFSNWPRIWGEWYNYQNAERTLSQMTSWCITFCTNSNRGCATATSLFRLPQFMLTLLFNEEKQRSPVLLKEIVIGLLGQHGEHRGPLESSCITVTSPQRLAHHHDNCSGLLTTQWEDDKDEATGGERRGVKGQAQLHQRFCDSLYIFCGEFNTFLLFLQLMWHSIHPGFLFSPTVIFFPTFQSSGSGWMTIYQDNIFILHTFDDVYHAKCPFLTVGWYDDNFCCCNPYQNISQFQYNHGFEMLHLATDIIFLIDDCHQNK